jgi:MFS family permease
MAAGHPYPNAPSRGKLIFRALGHRNFRLFAAGQGISLIGTWMQIVACGWLAYDLTTGRPEPVRAFWLGVAVFAGRVPTFFFAPLAGVLADRWNRKRVVVLAQILAMIQAAVLAALTLVGVVTLWELILFSLALGIINSLDVPARQSFLVEMVDDPADLPNAIALNSFLVNGARILGPAIAGILLQAAGAGFCFLLNALSYVFVVAALLVMAVRPAARGAASGHILRDLAAGVHYVLRSPSIRDVLLLLALVSLTGSSYAALLPVIAEQVLHQGVGLYAVLFAAAGAGALAGAAFLATRGSAREMGPWIAVAPSIFAVGLVALGLSRHVWLSVLSMPVIGFGMLVQTASSNTILQTLVVDSMRGRVMGLYSMAFLGMVPIGSLLAGLLARFLGAPLTVIACGVACIAGTVILAPSFLRPEYGSPAWTPVRGSGR